MQGSGPGKGLWGRMLAVEVQQTRKGARVPQPFSTPASQWRGLEDFEPLLRGYVLAPGEGQLLLHLAGPEGTLAPPHPNPG